MILLMISLRIIIRIQHLFFLLLFFDEILFNRVLERSPAEGRLEFYRRARRVRKVRRGFYGLFKYNFKIMSINKDNRIII